MPATALISANNINKRRGVKRVLSAINFELLSGELLLITGSNGCGKTTLLKLCAQLLAPDSGELIVRPNSPKRRCVWHSSGLNRHLTVSEQIRMSSELFRAKDGESARAVKDWGLEHEKNSPIGTLSAGTLKRVALSVAFLGDWELLFLDEPSSSLDSKSEASLLETLNRYLQNGSAATMISTHYPEKYSSLNPRILNLEVGGQQ